MSSRSWSTSSPRRIENVRDRTLVSVADDERDPERSRDEGEDVAHRRGAAG